MKKNRDFEEWVADHMATGLVVMEPYGYRKIDDGKYLHVFRITLDFEDVMEPFEGVAFIPIPFSDDNMGIQNFSFDEEYWDLDDNPFAG